MYPFFSEGNRTLALFNRAGGGWGENYHTTLAWLVMQNKRAKQSIITLPRLAAKKTLKNYLKKSPKEKQTATQTNKQARVIYSFHFENN